MIVQKRKANDVEVSIIFQENSKKPYKAIIDRNGEREEDSFISYDEMMDWVDLMAKERFFFRVVPFFGSKSYQIKLATDNSSIITIREIGPHTLLRYYHRASGMWLGEIELENITHLQISHDGQTVIALRGYTMEIWNLVTLTQPKVIPLPFRPRRASIWSDNQTIALFNSYELDFPDEEFPFIQLYDIASGQRLGNIEVSVAAIDNYLSSVVFSPQNDWVAFNIGYEGSRSERSRLYVLPISQHNNVLAYNHYLIRHQDCFTTGGAFTRDAKSLFLGMSNLDNEYYNSDRPVGNYIHMWKWTAEGKFIEGGWLNSHQATIRWLFITPDDQQLITVSEDGNICIWDVNSGVNLGSLWEDAQEKQKVTYAVLNQDGTLLALGDNNGRVTIWHIAKQKIEFTFEGHKSAIHYIAFLTTGEAVITSCVTGTILEWSLTTPSTDPKTI